MTGRLQKTLSSAGVMALTLSALSPTASVFVTGSAILRAAGMGAPLAVFAGGAMVMIGLLFFAELGAAYPDAGGVYPGVSAILGRRAARVVIALSLVTSPTLLAFVSVAIYVSDPLT